MLMGSPPGLASGVRRALRGLVEEQGANYLSRAGDDVVVVDLDACADGVAAVQDIRSAGSSPAIVALAGRGRGGRTLEYTLTLAEARGADVTVCKPADVSDVVRAISDAMACRLIAAGKRQVG